MSAQHPQDDSENNPFKNLAPFRMPKMFSSQIDEVKMSDSECKRINEFQSQTKNVSSVKRVSLKEAMASGIDWLSIQQSQIKKKNKEQQDSIQAFFTDERERKGQEFFQHNYQRKQTSKRFPSEPTPPSSPGGLHYHTAYNKTKEYLNEIRIETSRQMSKIGELSEKIGQLVQQQKQCITSQDKQKLNYSQNENVMIDLVTQNHKKMVISKQCAQLLQQVQWKIQLFVKQSREILQNSLQNTEKRLESEYNKCINQQIMENCNYQIKMQIECIAQLQQQQRRYEEQRRAKEFVYQGRVSEKASTPKSQKYSHLKIQRQPNWDVITIKREYIDVKTQTQTTQSKNKHSQTNQTFSSRNRLQIRQSFYITHFTQVQIISVQKQQLKPVQETLAQNQNVDPKYLSRYKSMTKVAVESLVMFLSILYLVIQRKMQKVKKIRQQASQKRVESAYFDELRQSKKELIREMRKTRQFSTKFNHSMLGMKFEYNDSICDKAQQKILQIYNCLMQIVDRVSLKLPNI